MNTARQADFRGEGRLLFTLVDALAEAHRLPWEMYLRWADIKARLETSMAYDDEAVLLHDLLAQLQEGGLIAGTWVEARFRALEARILGA